MVGSCLPTPEIPAQVIPDSQVLKINLRILYNLQPFVGKEGTRQGNHVGFFKNGKVLFQQGERQPGKLGKFPVLNQDPYLQREGLQ